MRTGCGLVRRPEGAGHSHERVRAPPRRAVCPRKALSSPRRVARRRRT